VQTGAALERFMYGRSTPNPSDETMTTNDAFAELPAPISSALVQRGFSELTAVQRAVVDAKSTGHDLRISSQTGSGKTVAIGLALASHFIDRLANPAPARPTPSGVPIKPRGNAAHPTALVIVPTRELAAQVREELKWLYADLRGLKVEVVTGGTSLEMERRALSRQPGLIVGTPGRLLDHMRNHAIDCDTIEHVVLDEADQMLDMGFREELEGILDQLPESRASHLMSATFPRAVVSLADRYQKNVLTLEGTRLGVANADIQHIAYSIRRHETYAALVNVLLLAGDSRCLLFVNKRVDATDLAEKLASDGFGAAPFSGELPQAQRTRTLAAFRSGTFNILVSTDVAARGIDVPDISTVVHVDPPRTSDAYIHRSGRTGRAGRVGRSILLVAGPESRRVTRMLQVARIEVSWQPVPSPEKVQKALVKQARRELHARLAEATPNESELEYAKLLIDERDPTQVVATLLEMAMPKPPCEPKAVVGLDPFAADRSQGRSPRAADTDSRSDSRPNTRPSGGMPANGSGPRSAPGPATFTRFTVSWGEKTGATASRVLSHVCRRGGLESHQVGAIQILAKSSTVDISSDIADQFEQRSRRPDKRDPGIFVRREDGAGSSDERSKEADRVPAYRKPARAAAKSSKFTKPAHASRPGSSSQSAKPAKPSKPAKASSSPPAGPARDARRPKGKAAGRPTHLKRKNTRRTASR
jgi:ATP-dependent RNA helicase DeaD